MRATEVLQGYYKANYVNEVLEMFHGVNVARLTHHYRHARKNDIIYQVENYEQIF
jgi:hypothetical protein